MTAERATTRRRLLTGLGAALAGATASLAGCGYHPGGGDVRWTEGRPGYRTEEVAVTGNTVYSVARSVMDYDFEAERWVRGAQVTAVPGDNRSADWSVQYGRPATAFGFGAGAAAVGLDGAVVRLGADGTEWRASVSGDPTALAVTDDRVYAVDAEGSLLACADGEVVWRRDLGGAGAEGPAVAATSGAVVANAGSDLLGFAPDGSRRWTADGTLAGRVAVRDGLVFAADRSGALDPHSGEERLATPRLDSVDGVAVTDEAVYVRSNGSLVAVDRSGDRRWSSGTLAYGSSVAANGTGAFVATDRERPEARTTFRIE